MRSNAVRAPRLPVPHVSGTRRHRQPPVCLPPLRGCASWPSAEARSRGGRVASRACLPSLGVTPGFVRAPFAAGAAPFVHSAMDTGLLPPFGGCEYSRECSRPGSVPAPTFCSRGPCLGVNCRVPWQFCGSLSQAPPQRFTPPAAHVDVCTPHPRLFSVFNWRLLRGVKWHIEVSSIFQLRLT